MKLKSCVALCILLAAIHVHAQTSPATIAGTVKDATGAVLPGVTVEASSPALIEKVRSVATDDTGQYKITPLQPGVYSVTFILPGFSTVRREGVQLTSGFTATISADLSVGQVAETVTVSGASPIVDVQNVRQSAVMTREVVDTIPTGKEFQNLATLVPGMVVVQVGNGSPQDVGGQAAQSHATMQIHGGRSGDLKLFLDGMGIVASTAPGTNGFHFTDGNFEEFVIDVAASSAEQETGGVRINLVPRDGGNVFKGIFVGNVSNQSLAANNITDELRLAGLRDANNIKTLWTIAPSIGGPAIKDRLWMFTAYTRQRADTYIAGQYYNKTLGTPLYTPDLSRQAVDDVWFEDAALRLTWQATRRNKFSAYYDYNLNCHCHFPVSPTVTPDAGNHMTYLTHVVQGTWSSPVTNRLLIEAGAMTVPQIANWNKQADSVGPAIIESAKGLTYGNVGQSYYDEPEKFVRASVSYVTGAHAAKIGFQMLRKYKSQLQIRDTNQTQTLLNGVPTQVSFYPTPATDLAFVKPDLGVFAQDQWTLKRMTANVGVRFDYLRVGYPDTTLAPTQNIPTERFFPELEKGNWKDVSPRLGVVYDLFGNGKTAIKGSVNRYVGVGMTSVSGAVTALGTDSRRWTDSNNNFIAEGDPTNPLTNGELGPQTNGRFAQAFIPQRYDPDAMGFGVRPLTNWELSAGVQHELMPRVSVNGSYFRRTYTTFQVTQNAAVSSSDYSPYCVVTPSDPRLPEGGGQRLCGLFDLNPNKVGQSDPVVTLANKFGDQTESWNGVDLAANVRLQRGFLLQGGLSTGKTLTDTCGIATNNPNVAANSSIVSTGAAGNSGPSTSTEFCHLETPFLTQLKLLGSYKLPWEIQVSGTYQNVPGPNILANTVYTSAQVAPSLGRQLASAATVTVNVIKPGTLYGERMSQFDLRLSKTISVGRVRAQGLFDLYNAFNGNAVVAVNNTYGTNGSTWLVPQRILPGRLVKFGVQMNF